MSIRIMYWLGAAFSISGVIYAIAGDPVSVGYIINSTLWLVGAEVCRRLEERE